MLMEPKNFFYFHVFHWVDAAIVGQALLWLDPQDHPVHLVLPVDHLHVLPPLSHYLLCNLFGMSKERHSAQLNAIEIFPGVWFGMLMRMRLL